eukprot:426365-Prymnesium_polylepis.1
MTSRAHTPAHLKCVCVLRVYGDGGRAQCVLYGSTGTADANMCVCYGPVTGRRDVALCVR